MFKLLKIVKEEDPRRPISTRSWRRRIPGAAGGRSVIDHAASTQSVIFNKKIYEHIYVRLEKIYISIVHIPDKVDVLCIPYQNIIQIQFYTIQLGKHEHGNDSKLSDC